MLVLTMYTWSPPPRFADGQFLSAEAHLNALARSTEHLLAMYLTRREPFPSYISRGRVTQAWEVRLPDGWRRAWSGYMRRKTSALRYRIEYAADVVTGLQVRVQTHDTYSTVISATGGSGVAEGTINVSSISYNTIYALNVDVKAYYPAYGDNIGQGWIKVRELYEEDPQSYAALASFNTGTTPTAAQWQALSDRAETLYRQLLAPRPVFQGGVATGAGVLWAGTFRHLHRYWYYDVRIRPPYGDGTCRVYLNIAGTDYLLGMRNTPADRYPAPHTPDEGDGEYDFWTHRGVVDVNALNLAEGETYPASVRLEVDGDATIATAKLLALWQQTPATPGVAWWEPMPTWTRGSAVTGAGNVKTIRNNLEDLSARVVYRNYPCVERIPDMPPAWHFRVHRFLHYYPQVKENAAPKLGYWAGDKWEEVALPYEPNRWLVYDLQSARRLFPGTHYRLLDITFAFEDVED